jgi:hypothetical protein
LRRLAQEIDMKNGLAKAALPEPRQRLLELMQTINFGRIEDLAVRGGNPVFDPPPRVVREIKIGGDNGPRAERDAANFLLKDQVVELLHHLDHLRDGTVAVLEVKHGLPFRLLVAETAA